MRRAYAAAIVLCVLLLAGPGRAWSLDLAGVIVGIADGDTVTLLTTEKKQVKIRLAQIDAPERKMPFGQRSRQHLSSLVFGKDVRVSVETIDQYGRTVGTLWLADVDVNLQQVRAGFAWAYTHYVHDPHYVAVEQQARAARRGLWADANPVPPWEWRHRKRPQRISP